MPVAISGTTSPRPNPPTLLAPSNGTVTSVAGGVGCSWTYNPAQAGNTQLGYYFERQVAGSSTWQWWDATNGVWSATAVYNAGAAGSLAFPPASWTDGQSYSWTVATVDQAGQSDYPSPFLLEGVTSVALSVTAPIGTITVADPEVQWTASWPTGYQQAALQVVIETNWVGTPTAPGTGTTIFDSGIQPASASGLDTGSVSPSGIPARAWVQLTGTNGVQTAWAYSSFTASPLVPTAPVATAVVGTDPVTGAPMVTLSAPWDLASISASLPADYAVTTHFNYSDDGVNWYPVRNSWQYAALNVSTGTAVAVDYEQQSGITRSYQLSLVVRSVASDYVAGP